METMTYALISCYNFRIEICLNCGDKGFPNALIHCVNCLEFVVHRYCLDKVTFTEFVPWLCDDCKENEITRTTNFDVVPPGTDLVEHSHVARPVDDPIWRGCYNFWNNKHNLDGVVAHLSHKASQSVSEKAKLLQLYLHFEMVSKDDLWPKYFNTPEANVDDIELFSFPRRQGGEHALRALTPYGELLIFTSTELPLHHWRYQRKCYLWGIFRVTQGSSSRLLVPNKNKTPDNVLAARDVVNDRAPTEDDAQVMTGELRRGKRIRKTIARFDDYDCSRD
ncbi:hypothetical protein KY290_020566 [Solanum tuberosum]|uniref:AIPP2-like SPOC-like domain-containing protein n=1 Tax=Solanum tuberosum TaxID=4113 RepID=A0ABQ7V112_SOLTU|nr:hypothetical protein KY290_020566 [Solanum tuberosum]